MARVLVPRNRIITPRGIRKPARFFFDQAHPLSAGLVGFWPLGEALKGITPDATGYQTPGTILGTPAAVTAGSHHGGLSFYTNARQAYIKSLGNYSSITYPFTMAIWASTAVAVPHLDSYVPFFFGNTLAAGSAGFRIELDESVVALDGYDGTNERKFETSSGYPSVNTWHHYTAVFLSGSSFQLYIDGVLRSGSYTVTGTPSVPSGMNGVCFGAEIYNTSTTFAIFSGYVEGARLYNRALSPDEAQQLYAEPYAGFYDIPANIFGSISQNVSLTGVSATAAVGDLTVSYSGSPTLTGASATAAAGSLGLIVTSTKALTGVSATAAVGTLTPSVSASVNLVGISAVAFVGDLYPTQSILTVPLITILNDYPIPVDGEMTDDDVPMEAVMPYQIAFEAVLNTNPIPMSGTMQAAPVPGEGSVP